MKLNRDIAIKFCLCLSLIIVGIIFIKMSNGNEVTDIEVILQSEYYSYLPDVAKDYVRKMYGETGEIILTEKNKKENTPYLNPRFVEYLTLSDEEKKEYGDIPFSSVTDFITLNGGSDDLPIRYDLRDVDGKNYMTPVRDQGNLGLCWAFASAGAAESHILRKEDQSYNSSSTLISERQIDYVMSRNGIYDYKSEYVSFINRSLGDGGNFYISTIAMASGVSLVDYNSFKEYNDRDLSKMELSDVISYKESSYEVDSTVIVPDNSLRDSTSILTEEQQASRTAYLNEIKQNIMENGAAYVGTYMSSSCQYTDSNLNNTVIDVYRCSISGGHAMEIIGWDDEISYSYCAATKNHSNNITNCSNIVSGKGVWILKNSWGDETQHPYLTYDSLYSSIAFIKDIKNSSEKDWDNNYIMGSDYSLKDKTFNLSETKIRNDEKVKKVKFISLASNSRYTVKVSKKNGGYETATVTNRLPGLVTVEFSNGVLVDSNSTVNISGDNEFLDRIMIFTENVNESFYIDSSEHENEVVSDGKMLLYSETKNLVSGKALNYKLYNSSNVDVTNKLTITNNTIAENNVNTRATFDNSLPSGNYRMNIRYEGNEIGTFNFSIAKMVGSGTQNDPYVITNSTQLTQIRNDLTGYYILGNDIDLSKDTHEGGKFSTESTVCPQGFGWESINDFSGTLDGRGHTIKGLYQNNYITCNESGIEWSEWTNNGNGLFGSTINADITIKNLVLEDFDMNCQGGYCGALLSKYDVKSGSHEAVFENIVLRNSSINGVYNSGNSNSSLCNSYGGGLFGSIESYNGTTNFSNIFIDLDFNSEIFDNKGFLASSIAGTINIENIQLSGSMYGKYSDGSDDGILINTVQVTSNPIVIKNILSTVRTTNITGLFNTVWGNNLTISNVVVYGLSNGRVCRNSNTCGTTSNINFYDESQLVELTKASTYSNWDNFNNNWTLSTIDNIPRMPILKNVPFQYTDVSNIFLSQVLNQKVSIYNYVSPKIKSAKRIRYSSNDESIVKINEDGIIIPQSSGSTTIHVESLYDGYINEIPINIDYVPHYDVIFDANGGTGEMEKVEVAINKNYKLRANAFSKENYEFNGWNTEPDGSGQTYQDLSIVNALSDKESITLYAQWIGENVVITFDTRGGNLDFERKYYRYGEPYGDLPIPTRDGYAFNYWIRDSVVVSSTSKVGGSVILKASWSKDSYTLMYDGNGGTLKSDFTGGSDIRIASNSLIYSDVNNGSQETLINNVYEKVGYEFKEWNTEADGSGTSYSPQSVISFNSVPNSTFRLYAIWNERRVGIVTFNANGGSGTMSAQEFEFGNAFNLNRNSFTRNGYLFTGWNTKSDGSGITYTDGQIITLNGNITLYAQWRNNKGTITFNANGGSGTMSAQEFTFNQSFNLNSNSFTRNGYIFTGWNTKSDGSGITYTDGQTVTLNGSITLYAQWRNNKGTVTFNANGGSGTMNAQEFTFGQTFSLNSNSFNRSGYRFKNWNTKVDGSGTSYNDGQTIILNGSITLYAIWEVLGSSIVNNTQDYEGVYDGNKHTITINVNVSNYTIKYSTDGVNYNLNTIPSYSEVGEYVIYYKINASGYNELTGSNKVKIYGIKKFPSNVKVKDEVIVLTSNSFDTLSRNIKLYADNYTITHLDSGKKVVNDDAVKTGDIIRVTINGTRYEYEISYAGDVNGDGKISALDYAQIKNHIMGTRVIKGNAKVLAADYNNDGKISALDYAKIKNKIMGG